MKKIATSVKANSYFGAGITDNGVMFGFPPFVKAMKDINVPCILGMNITVDNNNLSLFAVNEEGYEKLLNISFASQKDELSIEVINNNSKGLIAVLETKYGFFKENLPINNNESVSFNKSIASISKSFGDNFYLGIEVASKEDITYAKVVREFADKYTYKCVAFPRIRYAKKDDAIVLKIVQAISENSSDLQERKAEGTEYFMSEANYSKIYTQEELANTVSIVSSNSFDLIKKRGEILHFSESNSEAALRQLCEESLKEKTLDTDNRYVSQLNHELKTISEMGYPDYFLLVRDYVLWAKNNGILVGPGRGSAAGSLVSYLLNITEVDPIIYNLQFERFLNPNRKTMPDIDVDFMDIRRDEVVQYARDRFGQQNISNIVAFQTIQAKQALRDIGRVYSIPERHISLLSKALSNPKYTLGQSYKNLPEFKNLVDSDNYFKEIVSLAGKIEGLPRQSGQHAAGVIFNNNPIQYSLPVSVDIFDNFVSQYESIYLEEQGFLKMDFLGLRNLTTVSLCVDLINAHHPEAKLLKDNIPYDTKEVFDLISSGQTMGLFQIDTPVMKKGIKTIKPSCFEDVVALLALNRPGPMQFIKNYADRRDGKEKITYLSPVLEEVLSSTFGIIVYQEQINKIATLMAGFTAGEADIFRRAISKKEKDKMIAYEKQFIDGSLKNGHSETVAKQVFDLILKFADYGFNRSHSVVYAVLACRMAYLKAHYPLEFYAAILETGSSTHDAKFGEYLEEMKKRGIKVLPPSVNYSETRFTIKNNCLIFPLNAISYVDEMFSKSVINERQENGLFTDFFDFARRMYGYKLTENVLSKLVCSGAMDEFHPSRSSMLTSCKMAMQYAQLNYSESGQMDLGISPIIAPSMANEHDDPLENLDREYEVLGIMLSSNPLDYKEDLMKAKNVIKISDIPYRDNVNICGIVKIRKVIKTKQGTSMAYLKIYDQTGEIEITVFPKIFEKTNSIITKNNIIVVNGRYDIKGDSDSFIAQEISLLED